MNFRYRIGQKVFVNGRIITARYGQDPENVNFGGNILKITESREGDYGHSTGQGIETNMISLGLDMSYVLFHNYFVDFNFLYRNADAEVDELDINTLYIGGGLRVNLGNIISDY